MTDSKILTPEKDPMGAAILDYQTTGKAGKLSVLSSMFEEDEMPVKHLFRNFEEMPKLEQTALKLAKGHVLDVGAGAGCHALALQKCMEDTSLKEKEDNSLKEKEDNSRKEKYTEEKISSVKAIDISPLSCEAMKLRGIKDVECINLFDSHLCCGKGTSEGSDIGIEKGTNQTIGFDTILLLMNGTGIAGKIANLPILFNRLKALLNKNGQILIDSSDLKYIYENEDGSFDIDLNAAYYGEVDYQMVYHGNQKTKAEGKKLKNAIKGEPFDWLYVDFPLLKSIAESCGLHCELIEEGEHYDYLAKISLS